MKKQRKQTFTYEYFQTRYPQFNVDNIRDEMREIFIFIQNNKAALINAVEAHNRPPIEGIIKALEATYADAFSRIMGTDDEYPFKQGIGKIISEIMREEGYIPGKRCVVRQELSQHFSKSTFFEKATRAQLAE